jgi:hypothetical protein
MARCAVDSRFDACEGIVLVDRLHHPHHLAGDNFLIDIVRRTVSINVAKRTIHAQCVSDGPHDLTHWGSLRQNLEVLGSVLCHGGSHTYRDEYQETGNQNCYTFHFSPLLAASPGLYLPDPHSMSAFLEHTAAS